jgi:hypothetical protein
MNTLLIVALLVAAGAAYYFLVLKKKEENNIDTHVPAADDDVPSDGNQNPPTESV